MLSGLSESKVFLSSVYSQIWSLMHFFVYFSTTDFYSKSLVKRNSEILPINVLFNSESNREFKVEVNDGHPWPSKKHLSKSKTLLKKGTTFHTLKQVKQNATNNLAPFFKSAFNALSDGVLRFAHCVAVKDPSVDWL